MRNASSAKLRCCGLILAQLALFGAAELCPGEIFVPTASQRAEALKAADLQSEADLRAAIARGDTRAIFQLAELLRRRPTTPAKSPEVWDLYTRAARTGDWRAMKALNDRTLHDQSQRREPSAAPVGNWRDARQKMADMGDAGAMDELAADCLRDDDAIAWYRKSADRGDGRAMYELGMKLIARRGSIADDPPLGLIWLRCAAEDGQIPAMLFMARQRVFGQPWPANGESAIKWYKKAAEAGSADAMRSIGDLYRKGEMVPGDGAKATEWYENAAAADGCGLAAVAVMYEQGQAVKQDDDMAVKWYRKAAAAGEAEGMYQLGRRFELGAGVKKDKGEALRWYALAADAGSDQAMHALAQLGAERLPRSFNVKLDEVYLPDGKLSDDIDFIRQASRANVHVDWKNLAKAGIGANDPVDLRLDDVTLGDALAKCIEGAGHGKLTVAAIDGVVVISTPTGIDSRKATHRRHMEQPLDQASAAIMKTMLPEVSFENVSIADTLDFLRDVASAKFEPDWKSLAAAGVGKDALLSVKLQNVSLQTALEIILDSAGGEPPLDYDIRDGIVRISTHRP